MQMTDADPTEKPTEATEPEAAEPASPQAPTEPEPGAAAPAEAEPVAEAPAPEPAAEPPAPEPGAEAPAPEPAAERPPAPEPAAEPPAPQPAAEAPAPEPAAEQPPASQPAADAPAPEPAAEQPPAPQPAAEAPAPKQRAPRQPGAPRQGRPPRQREPLPWPELRAAATFAASSLDVSDLKELFRGLPNDVRDETIDGVREFRKGARRPVSAYAGKALARAVHTARRNRRRPEADRDVSDAIGQALAAEIVASLDVEIAAEVILPKRDLLEREARQARRRQRDEEDRERDERRRARRDADRGASGQTTFGTFRGSKIRGLEQLDKLLDEDREGQRS